MNSKQKGNITELEIILAFKKLGYEVSLPYGDNARYDLIVDLDGKFIRVQVKTSRTTDNGASFLFSCRRSNTEKGVCVHHLYTNEEIDFFATTFEGKNYLIPIDECGTGKRLRILPTQNKQNKNIMWAQDYILEEVVKKWQLNSHNGNNE